MRRGKFKTRLLCTLRINSKAEIRMRTVSWKGIRGAIIAAPMCAYANQLASAQTKIEAASEWL